jgi:uncharacterized membrane protein
VLNPVDLAELLGLASVLLWLRRIARSQPALASPLERHCVLAASAGLGFVWWNAMLARSVHQYAAVAFDPDELFHSTQLQVACSLSWTLIALAVMVGAHRKAVRTPWVVAAVLLAVVVAKLFLLDLERLSTPGKIISFLGVGALLLLVGYVAPVPPKTPLAAKPLGTPDSDSTPNAAGPEP